MIAEAPNLPPLSDEAQEALKKMQDDFIRMLAEKRIDVNPQSNEGGRSPPSAPDGVKLRENEQNVRNKKWEVTYSSHIQRCVNSVSYSMLMLISLLQGSSRG